MPMLIFHEWGNCSPALARVRLGTMFVQLHSTFDRHFVYSSISLGYLARSRVGTCTDVMLLYCCHDTHGDEDGNGII